ncbi:MAG TPA: flavin reductase family protein [Caulobacteraceae bacterium]|jgi:flavin reductase (DIM6/NTAB) family NADH-FMN oxidoreductase RutF|nr:flavin reductase family protein [Caulobacteraceae bacterium]
MASRATAKLQPASVPDSAPEAFDSLGFRRALGQFATGVAIVSALDPENGPAGEPVGLTISSFNTVSLSPPLVLFSVQRKAYALGALQRAKGYAVNILNSDQQHLSQRFGRALDASRWAAAPHALGRTGAPLIHGSLAHFDCEPYAVHDGGDHLIFVGRVVSFATAEADAPLVFFRGAYCKLEV